MLLLLLCQAASALSLDEAWEVALKNNPDLAMVHEQSVQADADRIQAIGYVGPKVSVGGNYTINQREVAFDPSKLLPPAMTASLDLGDPLVIQEKTYFDANFTIIQPLFSAAAIPGLAISKAGSEAGRAQERAVRSQVKLGVARAWWGLRVATEAEKIAEEGVALAGKHQATVAQLVQSGMATRQADLQAQIAVSRAERDLAGARARKAAAREALSQVMGQRSDAVPTGGAPHSLPFSSYEEALGRAEAARPELIAAEKQERMASLANSAVGLLWLPMVSGRFTEAWSENTGFSGENTNWMVVVSANWSLWDGGTHATDQVKAISRKRQAAEAVEKLQASVKAEVRNAWEERERAGLALKSAEREVELATENLRLAEVSLSAGAISFLDAEDARLGLNAARLTLLSEQMNLDVANLALLQVTGGL
jgi:protease secretion system outer membrane protein